MFNTIWIIKKKKIKFQVFIKVIIYQDLYFTEVNMNKEK